MTIRWHERYARRTERMTSSAIRDLLKITERPDIISFAGGLPAPEMFPVDEVAGVTERVLRTSGTTALQYGATEGFTPLRALIAERMCAEGVRATVDNVLITTGSQQAIDLIGKIMIDPGDRVVVESPTWLAALQAWSAYEAEFLAVSSDDDGMDVEAVNAYGSDPTLIYCLPNFQNPGGVTLSGERRSRVVDIARAHNVALLEDDPYHDVRFSGDHLPRLLTLDAAIESSPTYAGNVISLGSFSKVLAPGLRVGWVVGARDVITHLARAKQGVDLHTSTLNQMICYEMSGSGYLQEHARAIVQTYRHRRDVMLQALQEHFPVDVRWTRPEGGMFIWVVLPEWIDAADLLPLAMEEGVAFVPGQGFHPDGVGHNTLRLNFSNANPDHIHDGIRKLRRALDRLTESGAEGGRASVLSTPDRSLEGSTGVLR